MQLSLYKDNEDDIGADWTFQGAATRELTHCYHDYPARMIPQIAGKLLERFAPASPSLIFDPYCGTGTSLVESLIRGDNAIGTDLNPLARLIALSKPRCPIPKNSPKPSALITPLSVNGARMLKPFPLKLQASVGWSSGSSRKSLQNWQD